MHHGFLRLPYSRDDSAWGSVMIPITVAERRRADGAADRREPRRRIRGAGGAAGADAGARARRRHRPGHDRSVHEHPGLPRRHADLADRPGQPQPQLSRPAGRHADREDRRLFQPHAGADGGLRAGLPLGRQDARLPALRRRAPAGGRRCRRRPASPRCARSTRPIRWCCWRSTASACSTPPSRRSARSSSPPSSAAAAPRRRARSPSPARGRATS